MSFSSRLDECTGVEQVCVSLTGCAAEQNCSYSLPTHCSSGHNERLRDVTGASDDVIVVDVELGSTSDVINVANTPAISEAATEASDVIGAATSDVIGDVTSRSATGLQSSVFCVITAGEPRESAPAAEPPAAPSAVSTSPRTTCLSPPTTSAVTTAAHSCHSPYITTTSVCSSTTTSAVVHVDPVSTSSSSSSSTSSCGDDSLRSLLVPVRAFSCRLCGHVASERALLKHLSEHHAQQLTSSTTTTTSKVPVPLAYCVRDCHGRMTLLSGLSVAPAKPTSADTLSNSTSITTSLSSATSSNSTGKLPISPHMPASSAVAAAMLRPKRRGRPAGSRSLGLSALPRRPSTAELRACGLLACRHDGCGVRLNDPALMRLHERCHATCDNSNQASGDASEKTSAAGAGRSDARFVCCLCVDGGERPCVSTGGWLSLTLHLWREHGIDAGLYRCHVCDYRTTSYSRLVRQHLPTHGQQRSHVCRQCARRFKNAKQLANHTARVHSKHSQQQQLLVGQQDCEGSDTSGAVVLKHGMSDARYRKSKPPERQLCAECGATFAGRSSLALHVRRRHSAGLVDAQQLTCDHCAFVTPDHNTMRRHRMRHSGERPYRCALCDYSCIQAGTYKRHVRRQHPHVASHVVHSCRQCAFTALRAATLWKHVRTAHPDNQAVLCAVQQSNSVTDKIAGESSDSGCCLGQGERVGRDAACVGSALDTAPGFER